MCPTALIPERNIDFFAPECLRDPFDAYRELRDAGPVVKLTQPDVYAVGRFSDVQGALRRSEELISGKGVGFGDAWNTQGGQSVIQADGELHRRMRAVIAKPLSPPQLKEIRPQLKDLIKARVSKIPLGQDFDAMEELSRFLPVQAIAHFVGLQPEGRERMLDWAAAMFNAIGPVPDKADLESLGESRAYIGGLGPSKVHDGSWAAALFASVKTGKLSEPEAIAAISAYIFPSLDTTILAKGLLLHNLATNPDQWALLRSNPEFIPSAVLEGVRHSAVIRWFSRVAERDLEIGGSKVPRGARVMLLYGSANRDERHYENPDHFDVKRDSRDHLAWGTGPHICAGMHLARIEMEVLLEALVECEVELWSGESIMGENRGLYGYTELPFKLR
jgi:cytochrome P450